MEPANKKRITPLQLGFAILLGLMTYSILLKVGNGYFQTETHEKGMSFSVSYDFDLKKGDTDDSYFVRAFLPGTNSRQNVEMVSNKHQAEFLIENTNENKLGVWEGDFQAEKENVGCEFEVTVYPVAFSIEKELTYANAIDPQSVYVESTDFIEAKHPKIKNLARQLLGEETKLDRLLTRIFDHVYEIPVQPTKQLMTAVEAMEINAASCNGKSRLFVAICRNLDIPARVAGGIILNNEKKRTSHLWAEVLINDQWVPFDPLNGYYAYLPANYLEVYKGDEFLVKRSSDMLFDYNYDIAELVGDKEALQSFNMFAISAETGISERMLSLLLLLPFGALIVAIFRNVIGLKTFGVFLPVLIAISFMSTGVIFGIISFVGVLLVISMLNYPMLKMGILHVPKLVVMLSAVVFFMVIILFVGVRLELVALSGVTFFPIVILTISAEKYARIVVEEGFINASKILFQTILVTLFCYVVVSSNTIYLLIMNFPELLIFIAIMSLMLGKWIGLRISEYRRFGWIVS